MRLKPYIGNLGFGLVLVLRASAANTEPAVAGPIAPNLVTRGAQLFQKSCAHCHGQAARGDEGPDLHDASISEHRIAMVVQRGIKGEMPSFAKKYGPADVDALVAYLLTLQQPEH